ncbi:MAG: YqgE/AlgH family protein [Candidatus Nitrotoga sp.]
MSQLDFRHHFLIAMPAMADSPFAKTLVYVCEHNEQGALGIIVNRPTNLTLGELFDQTKIPMDKFELSNMPVYFGGPVQTDRGFVLHKPVGQWQSTLTINDNLGLTTSRDILLAVGAGLEPQNLLLALGYSGWAQGQLEHELTQNAWLTVPASEHILFELPSEERLPAAMALLGVDYASLSEYAGHA